MADGDVTLRTKLVGEDRMSPAFNKAGKSADHLSTRMVAVGTAIGHLAAGGILALGGMAAGAIKTGIQTAAAMQQAQLGFATLLGSEKAAGDYMKWLTGFAASTPFELKGLVESSRTLIGVGVSASDAKVMLQNFGDTASAIGIDQDAFQRVMLATSQAISAGKFQAGDLNQIMTNGIPVWTILSKAMHKSVPELRDLASHGKLLAKDVLPALQAEMHKDYGGAMAKQSQTLNGLWSTFQDTIHLGMANVLKPLIPIMQKVLPGAMETLGGAFKTGADAVKGFIDGVSGGGGKGLAGAAVTFHNLGRDARDAFGQIKSAIQFAIDHKDAFGALAAGAATGLATYKALSVVMAIYSTAMVIATGVQGLYALATGTATVAQLALDAALSPVLLVVGAIVVAVGALAGALIYAYTHSETFRNAITGAFGAVKDVILGAVGAILGAWGGLTASLSTVVGGFKALPGRIMGGITSLPGLFLGLIKTMFEKAAYAVGYSLGMLFNLFFVWPGKVASALASLPGKVVHWITTTGVQSVVAFYSFQVTLMAKAYALTGQLISWVAALVPKVVAWFRRLPGLVVAELGKLPGQIKAVFAAAGTWLLEAGKAIVTGLVNGIKNAAGSAVSAVKDLGGNLISGFSDAVGFNSPAKKFIPIGRGIVEGIEVGLKNRAPAVYNLLESFAQRISNIKVTAGVKAHLEKFAVHVEADMRAATARLDKVKSAVDEQRKKITDLIQARNDYANTLASGLTGGGSIAGIQLAQDTTDEEGNTIKADQAGGFLASLKAKADAIKKFGSDMNKLRAEGLSQDVLQQIAQAGLDTGGALATALATATPATIKSINSLSQQVKTESDTFGKTWAGQMYDSGIKAAEGIMKGLQSKESAILATIRALATNMTAEISKVLSTSAHTADASRVNAKAAPAGHATAASKVTVQHVHVHMQSGFIGSPDELAVKIAEVQRRAKTRGIQLA